MGVGRLARPRADRPDAELKHARLQRSQECHVDRLAGYVFNDGIVIVFAMLFPVLRAKTAREVKNRLTQAEQFTSILNGRRTARSAAPVSMPDGRPLTKL